jgi:hypothetical protein
VACIRNFLDSGPRRRKPVKLRSCCMRAIDASTTYYPAIYEARYSDGHSSSWWDGLSSFSKWVLYIIRGFTLLLLVWSVLPMSEHHKFGPKNFLVFCAIIILIGNENWGRQPRASDFHFSSHKTSTTQSSRPTPTHLHYPLQQQDDSTSTNHGGSYDKRATNSG